MAAMAKYAMAIISSSAQVGATGARRLRKVALAGGSAASKVELKDAATDTGNVLLTVNALTNDFKEISLEDVGGIEFDTAVYAKLTGTGAIAYIWYE